MDNSIEVKLIDIVDIMIFTDLEYSFIALILEKYYQSVSISKEARKTIDDIRSLLLGKKSDVFTLENGRLQYKADLNNSAMLMPVVGETWVHALTNQKYDVIAISNLTATKPEYIPTITYKNIDSGEVFSRPLSEWKSPKFLPL